MKLKIGTNAIEDGKEDASVNNGNSTTDKSKSGRSVERGIEKDRSVNTSSSNMNIEGIDEYIDILELLKKNKDKLEELLETNTGQIPKYSVPGIATTKTFSISSMLSNLIEEFSQAKGLSQKEMLHIAMIEFLIKYGYKEEIQIMLNRK